MIEISKKSAFSRPGCLEPAGFVWFKHLSDKQPNKRILIKFSAEKHRYRKWKRVALQEKNYLRQYVVAADSQYLFHFENFFNQIVYKSIKQVDFSRKYISYHKNKIIFRHISKWMKNHALDACIFLRLLANCKRYYDILSFESFKKFMTKL